MMTAVKEDRSGYFSVNSGQILNIADKIRLSSATQSRERQLLKYDNRNEKMNSIQHQEAVDDTSKSDRSSISNDSALIQSSFMKSSKNRVTSAYSASSTKEIALCWRTIFKKDPYVSYHHENDRITASEMCTFSGQNCKVCLAKTRNSSTLNQSQTRFYNDNYESQKTNPFNRVTSGKEITPSQIINNISKLPTTELFFTDLKQLDSKVFQGMDYAPKKATSAKYLGIKTLYEQNLNSLINLRNIHSVSKSFQNSNIVFRPPLIPVFQQKFRNSFFIC